MCPFFGGGGKGDVEELEGDRGRGKVENRVEWGKGGEVGRETRTPMPTLTLTLTLMRMLMLMLHFFALFFCCRYTHTAVG